MTKWLTAALLALLVLLVKAVAPLHAHPTSSSFVVIGVGASTVEVAITTDADALRLKLDALARPITELVTLRIDGRAVELTQRRSEPVPDRPGHVRITFESPVTSAPKTLQWQASLFLGSYPLAVRSGSAGAAPEEDREYEWIVGRESSRLYDLAALASADQSRSGFLRLVVVGFRHILPGGLDHVLFVLGLTLLAGSLRTLVLQVSLFTIAHSATLGLAMAGVVAVPSHIVEPLIAASIAYIAIENLRARSLTYWRLLVVLAFGLLHGLGFAGALRDTGLAGSSLASTLLAFNLGVELGQLTVVLATVAVLRLLPFREARQERLVLRPMSSVIAAIGLMWAVERVLS